MKIINKLNKKQRLGLFAILLIVLLIVIGLFAYKMYNTHANDDNKNLKPVVKEQLELENKNYNYYLSGNATEYQKELSKELKKVLSNDNVLDEEYAKVLTKVFISDLFTLNNKENSSDVTSSQYVYTDYQDTYIKMVKDSIYANIEIDLNGKRTQTLPIVTNVEITDLTRNSFKYNNKIIDNQAFYITAKIDYEKDLKYPTIYKLVIVKNDDLLQVVKASE